MQLGVIIDAIRKNGLPKATNGSYITSTNQPETYNNLVTGDSLYTLPKQQIRAACALGQAGINLVVPPSWIHSRLNKVRLTDEAHLDATKHLTALPRWIDLGYVITQLNDRTSMTLADIADWIERHYSRDLVV